MLKRTRIHPDVDFCHKWLLCLLLATGALSFMMAGCGKKAPPVPPKRPLPPVVQDLRHTIHGHVVELSWTLPASTGGSAAEPAEVKVLRAAQSGEEIGCEGCPLDFEIAAEIPIHAGVFEKSDSRTLRYTETIEPGYRYIYKIVVFDENGFGGKASRSVMFDHLTD